MDSLAHKLEYLSRGGPVMGLILIASVITIALIIERALSLRKKNIFPSSFLQEVENLASQGKVSEIVSLSRSHENPIARILRESLTVKDREKKAEQLGRYEVMQMEKFLDFLGLLATIGPLLGLLGTVTGMIETFGAIEVAGVGDPLRLSGGIAEALLNTAGGMIVAIPAYVAQRWFYRKVDRYSVLMERFVQRVLDTERAPIHS